MKTRILAIFLGLPAAACSSPPPPTASAPVVRPAATTPAPAPALAARPLGEWIDWPIAAGDWVYRKDERGSIALFGIPGKDALLTLRCDTARQRVYLARADVAAQRGGTLTVRSSSARKDFAAKSTGAPLPYLAVEIMPTDPILDAIVYTRGRFAVEATGQSSVAIPSWSEIARVVEDCRV